jgi:hypothetical protein
MAINIRDLDLASLNSATKYPSIPTYHTMADKGRLSDAVQVNFSEADADLVFTEKIDGTNGRIVLLPDGSYVVGSREELLYGKGDLIHNPSMGIVDALKPVADMVSAMSLPLLTQPGTFCVIYGEVYGGKITANSKQYAGRGSVGFRVFDVCVNDDINLSRSPASAAEWRDAGGQSFLEESALLDVVRAIGAEPTPRLPISRKTLPMFVVDTSAALTSWILKTHCPLDDGALNRPEGVVVRTPSRSHIAKLRFEDYERTVRHRYNAVTKT